MADLTADVEKRAAEFNAQKVTTEKVAEQGPRIVEGNTGTLTVMILDQMIRRLDKILEFIEEVKAEKV